MHDVLSNETTVAMLAELSVEQVMLLTTTLPASAPTASAKWPQIELWEAEGTLLHCMVNWLGPLLVCPMAHPPSVMDTAVVVSTRAERESKEAMEKCMMAVGGSFGILLCGCIFGCVECC